MVMGWVGCGVAVHVLAIKWVCLVWEWVWVGSRMGGLASLAWEVFGN